MGSKFWMVYGKGQRGPTFEHAARHLAEKEAKRLAGMNPGIEFVVLEAVGSVKATAPSFEWDFASYGYGGLETDRGFGGVGDGCEKISAINETLTKRTVREFNTTEEAMAWLWSIGGVTAEPARPDDSQF